MFDTEFDPDATARYTYGADDDPVMNEVREWHEQQQMDPDDRKRSFIEQRVWAQGMTVDEATGEIVDPETGKVVGRLPDFT